MHPGSPSATGAIAGGVIGAVVLVAIVIAVLYVIYSKRRTTTTPSTAPSAISDHAHPSRSTVPAPAGELRMNPIYDISQQDDGGGDFDFEGGHHSKPVPGAEAGYIDVEGAGK